MVNQLYDDKRVVTGKSSMLLYRDPSDIENYDGRYSILIPLTTIPSIDGSTDTVEFNFTTSRAKGKLETGTTLDEKDVEYMLHRDNLYRLEALQDKVLDFLIVNGDLSGREFTATITVKYNDQTRDEVATGTFTLVPKTSGGGSILNCRPLIKDTVYFTNAITDSGVVSSGEDGLLIPVEVSVSGATITPTILKTYDPESGEYVVSPYFSATYDGTAKGVRVTQSSQAESAEAGTYYSLVAITVSKTGYASWTTTVALEFTKE